MEKVLTGYGWHMAAHKAVDFIVLFFLILCVTISQRYMPPGSCLPKTYLDRCIILNPRDYRNTLLWSGDRPSLVLKALSFLQSFWLSLYHKAACLDSAFHLQSNYRYCALFLFLFIRSNKELNHRMCSMTCSNLQVVQPVLLTQHISQEIWSR